MQKIAGPGATIDNHFTEGNPATSTPATVVTAAWMNSTQDEQEAILTAAGMTPDVNDNGQLVVAIQNLIGRARGFRNALINADFSVAQRLKTRTFSVAGTGVSGFVMDRWLHAADTSGTGVATGSRQAFTVGQTAVPGGPRYHLRHQQTTAASVGNPVVSQKIESVRPWSSIDATFSVWLKAAAPLSITARVVQNFGTGGSPSASVVAGTQVMAVTTTWTLFQFTIAMPTISGKTLGTADNDHLLFELQCPTGVTFTLDVSRAMFEAGSAASEFDARPLAVELELCKRYFEKSWEAETDVATSTALGMERCVAYGWANAEVEAPLQGTFNVEKRAVPTITWYPTPGVTITAGQIYNGSVAVTVNSTLDISRRKTGTPITSGSGTADPDRYSAHWTADAEL